MKKEVYLGLYLGGVKKDKSALLVLESYQDQKRLVVSEIEKTFKALDKSVYPDEILKDQIRSYQNVKFVGVNFPLSVPPCISCELACPGLESCEVSEVRWLLREYKKADHLSSKSKKERKIASPYSERALDFYISQCLEEPFPLEPAFGSSRSAFYGRGRYLQKGLPHASFVECFTKASLWRIGSHYGLRKSVLRNFYKSEKSEENRDLFLRKIEADFFLYEEDRDLILHKKNVFEALLLALSVYFFDHRKTEKMPLFLKESVALPLFS